MDRRILEASNDDNKDGAVDRIISPILSSNETPIISLPVTSSSTSSCLIIYTGGTFGMAPDKDNVLVCTSGFLAAKIASMDEFKHAGMPFITVEEWEEPIDSSDMNPDDWIILAKTIERNYWDYDGFVVLQGTDTMAYTASALSFILQNLGKTVVLAGAMIPLHYPHSDARRNLIMSVIVATCSEIPEVVVYSNDKILRGNRTTKISNMSTNAFDSPNASVLGTTGVEMIVDQSLILPHPRRRFAISDQLCTDVCVFRLVPGFNDAAIRGFIQYHQTLQEGTVPTSINKAMVFALYGTGNASLRKGQFLSVIEDAIRNGIGVVITSQCPQGRTQLDCYATGRKLLDIGVITTFDMTTEACVTKLAYLMGLGMPTLSKLKSEMETNIRGEMTDISLDDSRSRSSTQSQKVFRTMCSN